MQIKNGASNEILKTLANRVTQGQKGDKFLASSTLAAANLTGFADILDKFNGKANLNDAASKFTGGEASSFLLNLARDENEAQIYAKLEREAKEAAKMFKKFDFMQMMTKLEMGNLKDGERAEIFAKMNKIAREI
ncbi:hypothetical protein [uncultured Campylobacter sp.]|uniref:hypothetical protein n=1 Tax=uncultured Campylobacter sp. TaxID=218934 RepID=UPI0026093280|nr:hypothetical protein [uncultured Campylobacter sp.]